MNDLRPFRADEIGSFGGPSVFLEPSWQTSSLAGLPQVWSIPWLLDARFLYYRRDLIDRIGLKPEAAFRSDEAMKSTLKKLVEARVKNPLVIPTQKSRNMLHNAASWVWGANADFANPEGSRVLFDTPEFIDGMSRHFELGRYLAPTVRGMDANLSDEFFIHGQAAVTISGPWLQRSGTPVMQSVGVTYPPGKPFIGGSNLVIWKSCRHSEQALELIRFLTGKHAQETYFCRAGLWPVRLDVLQAGALASDPMLPFIVRELHTGRSIRLMKMWGLIEERLTNTLQEIWRGVLLRAKSDVRPIVTEQLRSLAARTNDLLLDRV